MKKIGFIDHYIDNWHAGNYPKMIRESSFKDKYDVALAWQETTPEGKKPLDAWCKEHNIGMAESIKQVVKECDCLVVLSPNNGERHEDLADLPLKTGKPVYIDKPIAPSLAAAKRLFAKAEKHSTPMMSSSALRFGSALVKGLGETIGGQRVRFASARGAGVFHNYAIHQIEMIVMTLGTGAKRVMQCGNEQSKVMAIDYGDDRRGLINLVPSQPFQITIQYGDNASLVINEMNDFFQLFIEAMLKFFDTGVSPVPKAQTLEIAALVQAGQAALSKPDKWIKVP